MHATTSRAEPSALRYLSLRVPPALPEPSPPKAARFALSGSTLIENDRGELSLEKRFVVIEGDRIASVAEALENAGQCGALGMRVKGLRHSWRAPSPCRRLRSVCVVA